MLCTQTYSDVTFQNLCKWMVKFHIWASIARIFPEILFLGISAFHGQFSGFFLVFIWLYKIHACTHKLLHGSGTRMLKTQQELDPSLPFHVCTPVVHPWGLSTFLMKLGCIEIFKAVLQEVATKIFELRLKIKVICQLVNRWEAWYIVSWI